MRIARISYLNTEPYYYCWENPSFPLISGVPRELALATQAGRIDGGPLPVVECWKLKSNFSSLGCWGIAAREKSRSVFLLSHKPMADLDRITIGVTKESATSVALCQVLIGLKYGHRAYLRRGLTAKDEAWLIIGDQALKMGKKDPNRFWGFKTDLATEWWDWQKLPFVFAEWIVRRDFDYQTKTNLRDQVEVSLKAGLASIDEISQKKSDRLGLSPAEVKHYLQGFTYVLGKEEFEAMSLFKELYKKVEEGVVLA